MRFRRKRRDRPGLDDGERTFGQCPLDVHRHAVELLDLHAHVRQFGGLCVVQHGCAAQRLGDWVLLRATFQQHGHHLLVSRLARKHPAGRLVHRERVWRHLPAHDGLAQAPGRREHGLVALAGDRVGGEQNARRLRRHQHLHDHRQADRALVDAVPRPVTDHPRRPQRGPAPPDRVQHTAGALDVEERVLLAGEGEVGQVLGRGRRTHGDRRIVSRQSRIRLRDGPGDRRRHLCLGEQRANTT